MTDIGTLVRTARSVRDRVWLAAQLAQAAADPSRPIMAHLIVTRRCNLSCGYCHEYSADAAPVPLDVLRQRLQELARLRVILVTLTGGESLLHPQIAEVVRMVRELGMVPVMNSNGFLLNQRRVNELNRAGLFAMQISVDNVEPDRVSMKSLRPLLPKLRVLAEHAEFSVRINTVLTADNADEALAVARAAIELGFDAKCSLVRDEKGAVKPLDAKTRAAYDAICRLGSRAPAYLSEDFQATLADRGTVEWKCRSGARYFMVCEDGLVHLCESSWGNPGIPLSSYTSSDIARAFSRRKSCAPTCAVAYAHQISRIDGLRGQRGGVEHIEKQCWAQTQPELVRLGRKRAA